MPEVSVIVPVYNSEAWVGKTINSILNQTLYDLEIILINDGSTDGSLSICRNYEALDKRVRVIDRANHGVSSARNAGLSSAQGDYILFVDSDDTIEQDMLEKMAQAMDSCDADIVICNGSFLTESEEGKLYRRELTQLKTDCVLDKDAFFNSFCKILNETYSLESVWNKLIKRDYVTANHLSFPEDVSFGEDFIFFMRYFPLCEKVALLKDSFYNYNTHNENSLTRRYKPDHMESELAILRFLEKMLKSNNAFSGENIEQYKNYCAIHIISGFKELFNQNSPLSPEQKEAIIKGYIENDFVCGMFQPAAYAYAEYLLLSFREPVLKKNAPEVYRQLELLYAPKAPETDDAEIQDKEILSDIIDKKQDKSGVLTSIKGVLKRVLPMPAKTHIAKLMEIEQAIIQQSEQLTDIIRQQAEWQNSNYINLEQQLNELRKHAEAQTVETRRFAEQYFIESRNHIDQQFIDIREYLNQQISEIRQSIDAKYAKLDNNLTLQLETAKKNRELLIHMSCEQSLVKYMAADSATQAPQVSIIVPVYNAEPYLRECLDSIRAQTLWNFELICVNDGSTDSTAEILEYYAKIDPRITVINQENSNAGVARNNGMKKASGDYLMFLDADDFFEPFLLLRLYETCTVYDADMCICTGDLYDNATGLILPADWLLFTDLLPTARPFSWRECPERIFQITTPCPWTKMYRRSFVEKHGIQFQSITRANDLYFVYTAIALSEKITVFPEPLVHYRTNVTNSLQTNISESPLEFYNALSALQLKLKEEGLYSDLARSFAEMAIINVMSNVGKQTTNEAAGAIIDAYLDNYISQFDINNNPKEFLSPYAFRKYEQLLTDWKNAKKCD